MVFVIRNIISQDFQHHGQQQPITTLQLLYLSLFIIIIILFESMYLFELGAFLVPHITKIFIFIFYFFYFFLILLLAGVSHWEPQHFWEGDVPPPHVEPTEGEAEAHTESAHTEVICSHLVVSSHHTFPLLLGATHLDFGRGKKKKIKEGGRKKEKAKVIPNVLH